MRGIFEGVVGAVKLAGFDSGEFGVDGEHGIAEAVQLGKGLTFRGLDHEGAGDRPAHGGSVESKIHESLGDVLDFDAGTVFPLAKIEDAFVSDASGFSLVEDREMRAEAGGDVVRVQD